MGGDQSETFYQDFLQHMRSVYRPDAIKGNYKYTIHLFALRDHESGTPDGSICLYMNLNQLDSLGLPAIIPKIKNLDISTELIR